MTVMGLISFTINGTTVSGAVGETILKVAGRAGISIPTLCHHEAVEDEGACRLCMVEITHKDWKGWTGLVTACLYPIEPGLEVATDSEDVRECRRNVLDLLLARCPTSPVIRDLAAANGLTETTLTVDADPYNCMLCGLCTRICAQMGHHAISTVGRGVKKTIGTPMGEPAETCVGCAVCARICPTDAITFREDGQKRRIWGQDFEMMRCSVCGTSHITRAQAEYICEREGMTIDDFDKCDACRSKDTALTFTRMVQW
jgi:bidirectional [NiFe] hydrogenase diaphorase subunit